jgi:subtilisin family serine protease
MAKTEPGQATSPESNQPKPAGGAGQPKPDEARAASIAPGEPAPGAQAGGQPGSQAGAMGRSISERKGQFLIAARRPQALMAMGIAPLQFSVIEQTLRASPDIEVVDTVGPKNIVGVLADGMGDAPSVLVARMTEQKAAILHQQAQGRLIVERDQSLALLDTAFQQPNMVASSSLTTGPVLSAAFVVLGKDNAPVKDAEVYLFGSMLPASGVTNERGQVTLTLYGETPQSIRSLYVKPKADYWSFYQQQPDISTEEANVVGLRPLSDWPSLSNFPQQQSLGWGQKAMRLDQLPGNYRGQGVKIAIIDSGAATTHEDLKKIRFGFDVINKKTNPNSWNEDTVSHGSHCAGIIAGADNTFGVRGFAPDAEIHACKLFPGGQISQLIDALEYCIEKQIDVVNLSLGGAEPSEALEQQIQRAKRAGIACIVAAGNSGGRVQYPGASPNVLAVSAIGKLNEFPPDSYHSQTVTQLVDQNGFFSARFTCYGPEIGVCGPGVAIASSVPPNNFAVWDGTSMATPHITGLAALVLAHHPDFQGPFKTRGPERVERLFQVIRASARPVNLGDPSRTGFGLPDVLVAVGLQTHAGVPVGVAAAVPQQAGISGAIGGVMGGVLPQQTGIYPFGAAYYDPGQLAAQAWMANNWLQGAQQMGGGLNLAGVDPAIAAAYYRQQLFGMPSGFVRQGW